MCQPLISYEYKFTRRLLGKFKNKDDAYRKNYLNHCGCMYTREFLSEIWSDNVFPWRFGRKWATYDSYNSFKISGTNPFCTSDTCIQSIYAINRVKNKILSKAIQSRRFCPPKSESFWVPISGSYGCFKSRILNCTRPSSRWEILSFYKQNAAIH